MFSGVNAWLMFVSRWRAMLKRIRQNRSQCRAAWSPLWGRHYSKHRCKAAEIQLCFGHGPHISHSTTRSLYAFSVSYSNLIVLVLILGPEVFPQLSRYWMIKIGKTAIPLCEELKPFAWDKSSMHLPQEL